MIFRDPPVSTGVFLFVDQGLLERCALWSCATFTDTCGLCGESGVVRLAGLWRLSGSQLCRMLGGQAGPADSF